MDIKEINNFSQDLLSQILFYDANTGELFWKLRDRSFFKTEGDYNTWNKRFSGKPALSTNNGKGYLGGRVFGKHLYAHRVIWVLAYGDLTDKSLEIDHINGDRSDNRVENLRCVSRSDNNKNTKRRSGNTSGVTGVHWSKKERKWIAQACNDGKRYHLGGFLDKDAAISARKLAEDVLGFHENHGRSGHEDLKLASSLNKSNL